MSTLLGLALLAFGVYGFISWRRGDGPIMPRVRQPVARDGEVWVERGGTRHSIHLLLTIFTLGLWIPVWIVWTALSPRRRYERR